MSLQGTLAGAEGAKSTLRHSSGSMLSNVEASKGNPGNERKTKSFWIPRQLRRGMTD